MTNRIWARTGSQSKVVCDHRYDNGYGYLFAAACPERDLAVGHVCDRAATAQMNRHLQDISGAVETGAHAVLVLDGAGWHKSKALDVPTNLSLVHLPPYSPELNSMEQVFQFLRSNTLSNQVFETVEDLHTALADAWDRLVGELERIRSITSRKRAVITP